MQSRGHSIGRRAACALLVSPFAAWAAGQQSASREPYLDRTKRQLAYEGPVGDEPEPEGLTEVRIGYFGPSDPADIQGGSFWVGALQAITEANQAGGYHGLPFRLVPKWSESPWKAGGRKMVELAYVDNVWAVVGSVDAIAAHVAEQVIAKVRIPMLDPGSTDRSVNAAMVPWMFSCLPGDPVIAEALAPALAAESGESGPVLLTSTGHDERRLGDEFKHWFSARQPGIQKVIEFQPGTPALAAAIEPAVGARSVLVLASIGETASIVKALRERSPQTVIYAGPVAARGSFRSLAAAAAEGIRCPRLTAESAAASEIESGKDYAALQCYDATRMVVAAVRTGGLNRVRICRALARLSPWQGMAGEIRWSTLNRNLRPAAAGIIRGGRLETLGRRA